MNNAQQNWNCPALMNDGRESGTDYRPSCEVNDLIMKQNNLKTSYDFRQFMINNASELMQKDRQHHFNLNECDSCKFTHIDPNNNDKYWNCYTNSIGYQRNFNKGCGQ